MQQFNRVQAPIRHLQLIKSRENERPVVDMPKYIPPLECPTCHTEISDDAHGWLRTGFVDGKTQFIPCPTCSGDVQQRQATKRQAQLVQRLFGGADIPWKMRDYEFSSYPIHGDQRSMKAIQGFVRHHANGQDMENKRGLWLHSNPGYGKTSLAVCALKEVLRHGNTGIFVLTSEFFKRLRASFNAQARREAYSDELLDAIETVPWLVLDDVGVEKPTDYILEQMYGIVTLRMQNQRYTIFTSNFSPRDLGTHWCKNVPENEIAGARIVERIKEYCAVIEVKGANLREKLTAQ